MTKHMGLKWISVATSVGMFLVLLGGALVTNTKSGRGCGEDWPLCNGKFIPAYTLESMIEYSHRAVSGIVGLLVLATAIWAWTAMRHRKGALLYAFGALFFTVLQAMLGAMAVIWEQSSAVLALHFGISLLAFSCTLLLSILIFQKQVPSSAASLTLAAPATANGQAGAGEDESNDKGKSKGKGDENGKDKVESESKNNSEGKYKDECGVAVEQVATLRHNIITQGFAIWVWATTIYAYIVIYIGAYVRHTKSSGGCTDWPLCNGKIIPDLSITATSIVFGHRVAALLLFVLIVWLAFYSQRHYSGNARIRRAGLAALLLVILQVISGASIVYTMGSDLYLFSSLLHTVLITFLFGVLCYYSVLAGQLRRSSEQ